MLEDLKMEVSSKFKRVSIILILATILVFINYYYALEANNHLIYPSYGAILSNYPVGEVVYIQGSVIEIDSNGYSIIERYHNQPVVMHVAGELPGELGDEISLLGVLEPSYQVGILSRSMLYPIGRMILL